MQKKKIIYVFCYIFVVESAVDVAAFLYCFALAVLLTLATVILYSRKEIASYFDMNKNTLIKRQLPPLGAAVTPS